MAQVLGIIDIVVNGTAVDVEKGAKLKLGGYKQNPVLVQGRTHYAREYEGTEIDFTTVLQRGDDMQRIFGPGTKVVQCNCDTGQSYIISDAFTTNRPEITAGEGGKISVKMAGSEPEVLQNG